MSILRKMIAFQLSLALGLSGTSASALAKALHSIHFGKNSANNSSGQVPSTSTVDSSEALDSFSISGSKAKSAQVPTVEAISVALNQDEMKRFFLYRNYLISMGYEDFSARAETAIKKLSESSPNLKILTLNKDRLDILNSTRDLSAYIMARIAARLQDKAIKTRLSTLTARNLTSGVKGLPDKLPLDVGNIEDPRERRNAALTYLKRYFEKSAKEAFLNLRSDVLSVLYTGEQIVTELKTNSERFRSEQALVSSLVAKIVAHQYNFLEMAKTQFLGKALALSVVREAKVTKNQDLLGILDKVTFAHGSILKNHVTNSFTLVDIEKDPDDLDSFEELNSGNLVMRHSELDLPSFKGARFSPAGSGEKIIQSIRGRSTTLLVEGVEAKQNSILAKKQAGDELSFGEGLFSRTSSNARINLGYTGLGIIDVRRDFLTGIKTVWVLSNRETLTNDGGIILSDLEGFQQKGFSRRIAVGTFDVDGLAEINTGLKIDQAWLQFQAAPSALNEMKEMMIGDQAVSYNWASHRDGNKLSSARAIYEAYKKGAGLNITDSTTEVVGGPPENNVVTELDAPSLFLWSSRTINIEEINTEIKNRQASELGFFGLERPPMDSQVYIKLGDADDQDILLNSNHLNSYSVAGLNSGLGKWLEPANSWGSFSPTEGNMEKSPDNSALKSGEKTGDPSGQKNVEKSAVASVVTLSVVDSSTASIPSDHLQNEADMKSFLEQLGFDDLASKIKASIDKHEAYSPISARQQLYNLKYYSARNLSRDLSVYLMNRMQGRLNTEAGKKQLAEFAAYLVSQQPMNPIKKYYPEVLSIEEPEERAEKMDEILSSALRQTMSEHTRMMVSETLFYLFGSEVSDKYLARKLTSAEKQDLAVTADRLFDWYSPIVDRMYLDANNGQSKELGDAFSLLLARQAELRHAPSICDYAKKAFAKYGLHWENYVGDTIVLENIDGKPQTIKITDFSIALTLTIDTSSAVIPFGAIPNDKLFDRAERNGLVGSLSAALNIVTPEDIVENNGESIRAHIKDQKYRNATGYSHYGEAFILQAKGSNIKSVMIGHNYPHPIADNEEIIKGAKFNPGGLVYTRLSEFLNFSHHASFKIANKNLKLLFQAFLDFKKTLNGKVPQTGQIVFDAPVYKFNLDPVTARPIPYKEGDPLIEDPWTLESSQADLNALYKADTFEEWYPLYRRLVLATTERMLVRGLTFHWITPDGHYRKGSGYCSQTWSLIPLVATGFDPEILHGRWHKIVKFGAMLFSIAKFFHMKDLASDDGPLNQLYTMSDMKIVSPSSMAGQTYVETYYPVVLPYLNLRQRVQAIWGEQSVKQATWKEIADRMLPLSRKSYFFDEELDAYEVRSVAEDVDHTLKAKYGFAQAAVSSMESFFAKAPSAAKLTISPLYKEMMSEGK